MCLSRYFPPPHVPPASCTSLSIEGEEWRSWFIWHAKPLKRWLIIGHVDSGKSVLMGQLALSMGAVTQQDAERLRRDCLTFGWTRPGYTSAQLSQRVCAYHHFYSIGFDVYCPMGDARDRFQFLEMKHWGVARDAPIHKVAQRILLLVSANELEFDAGLTHLTNWLSIAIQSNCCVVVAINKLDEFDQPQHRFKQLEQTLSIEGGAISFVPVSALTGQNLVTNDAYHEWYSGPSLLESLRVAGEGFQFESVINTNKPYVAICLEDQRPRHFGWSDDDASDQRQTLVEVQQGIVRKGQCLLLIDDHDRGDLIPISIIEIRDCARPGKDRLIATPGDLVLLRWTVDSPPRPTLGLPISFHEIYALNK